MTNEEAQAALAQLAERFKHRPREDGPFTAEYVDGAEDFVYIINAKGVVVAGMPLETYDLFCKNNPQ